MSLRVLVIGATGFLGHHVTRELVASGHDVTAVARRPGTNTHPHGNVTTRTVDIATCDRLTDLLQDHDGLVFAAGADDRAVPPAPAYRYFETRNVAPVRRLMAAAARTGCTRAVVLGSYFTALHRTWPGLDLPGRHPYIRSRVEQARAARETAAGTVAATVLEIPFAFGSAPGRTPLWAPLVRWLRSPLPLAAPPGGTAVVTARTVARATVRALEQRATGPYPVVDENLAWATLLHRFAEAAGRPRPVHRLPPPLLRAGTGALHAVHTVRRRQPGLQPPALATLLTRELFLDPAPCRALTGRAGPSVREALADTVHGCRG
ncbi:MULTISPECIES: NAD-dependent epimerase/dehydratase family protein [Streptomyces]|uniref:NAD-dependent epimerase/dehydratase family protein n=1 Tax=Streptomyces TaxID=1883 RepID=UPI00163C63CD|nr:MULTISPECIES: NAD(P)H-binding protein [Streptomyces]MBC2878015.1 NAD(P)H-binding protein [Streptomyces sp. TYQ1024]UBI39971.1 NAD(P)H-binding protein [Streptomyces mobaraensis]UKW32551.1 NAD(P)H-binding protein [Streptomyces sp. TYQ1024]